MKHAKLSCFISENLFLRNTTNVSEDVICSNVKGGESKEEETKTFMDMKNLPFYFAGTNQID